MLFVGGGLGASDARSTNGVESVAVRAEVADVAAGCDRSAEGLLTVSRAPGRYVLLRGFGARRCAGCPARDGGDHPGMERLGFLRQ